MDYRVNFLLCKEFVHSLIIATIDLIERNIIPADNFLYALEAGHIAI